MSIPRLLKDWVPPAVMSGLRRIRNGGIRFGGSFATWESAIQCAEGYDAETILERVHWATQQVVSGMAVAERDSVLLEQRAYPFPVISVLLRAAIESGGNLRVLDFGGSLGSSYHQCKDFLKHVPLLNWSIVEQRNFVNVGRREFENGQLRFYCSIKEAALANPPHVVIASSVLQYLRNPLEILASFVDTEVEYIVIDRTPIAVNGLAVITIQSVPNSITPSSYPLRLFNEDQLKAPLLGNYDEIATFPALDGVLGHGVLRADFKGFIFKRKSSKDSL